MLNKSSLHTSLVVQKYGGTSVANIDRLMIVSEMIRSSLQKYPKLVVVVSAMAGETDRLIKLAESTGRLTPLAQERDVLLATGEQTTASLLAMMLANYGIKARSLMGFEVPILTSTEHCNAKIETISPHNIFEALHTHDVVVVAGFQGVASNGRITTLGRGGSDLTAVALTVAVGAKHCEIYTDVQGVYTTDPNVCSDARLIPKITHEEMLELASLGAKVLQTRSVQLAKRYQLPVWVGSAFEKCVGTWVVPEEEGVEGTIVSAITCDRKESQLTVRGISDFAKFNSVLFKKLSEAKINVDVIVFCRGSNEQSEIMFTVNREHLGLAVEVVASLRSDFPTIDYSAVEKIAKVSAVGLGMKTHSGVAHQMFETLSSNGIPVLGVSTSEIKISCLIEEKYAELSVRILHEVFGLAKEPH